MVRNIRNDMFQGSLHFIEIFSEYHAMTTNQRRMIKVKKKLLSLALCVIMLLSMSGTVLAAEKPQEGSVTIEVTPSLAAVTGENSHSIGMLNAFYGEDDLVAVSELGSFEIRSSSVPAGATITRIEVTSTKSSGSTGSIDLYVAKDEDNGDGTFDRYTDFKPWASSLSFPDFGNYNLSAAGIYYVQFEATRYSAGTIAAATLRNVEVTVYYR